MLNLSCAGRKVDFDEVVEKQLREWLADSFGMWGGTHRSLPSAKLARGIAKSWCFGKSKAVTLSLTLST